MPFHIRPATPADAASIAQIHVASWKTTYPGIVPQAALDALNEEDRRVGWQGRLEVADISIFVAESETGVFGFLAGGPIRTPVDGYDGELYALYLLEDHHRQGAGRALLQQLAQTLHKEGLQSMLVWVLEANPAVGFYQHLGAIPVTRQTIEIGGATLPEIALGWPNLKILSKSAVPK
jgi:ribosomal protein S18 acetylase RimI-like enzyme